MQDVTVHYGTLPAGQILERAAVAREHRSIANMVEAMIRVYCGRNGFAIPEPGALFATEEKITTGEK